MNQKELGELRRRFRPEKSAISRILIRPVLAAIGHVVGVMGQEDEVIALPHVQRVNDLPVE